jgi:DNA-directed RNA polymerase specialized sigma24 family protein
MARLSAQQRTDLRRVRRALRHMAPLDRTIFLGVRVDDASYCNLADLHSLTVPEVEQALARSLVVLLHWYEQPDPWWWRLWP